ncbi:ABC transporter permease, partial [Klebsiella pneumoniae]|nr:ABC transporter permease [Klebsiella pneumoniae]
MVNLLARLGARSLSIFSTFCISGIMLFRAFIGKPEFRKQWPLLMKQLYSVGVQSLLIIMVSGLFIGM